MGAGRLEEGRGMPASLGTSSLARGHAKAPATGAAPGQVALFLPERPRLAPGIRLAGQMPDSGYKEPPWLLEREGEGYVQVTQLLYRLAELSDGAHTIERMANEASESTGRTVSPDNVRQLLTQQFLVRGLIVSAEGTAVQGRAGSRSLLAMRMKTRSVSPEVVQRLAGPLRWLFFPPVLLLVLVVVVAFQAWIFFVHGVAAAVHQAFYTSGLALAVIGLVVVAAAIHELGHAAALRYGGGKPGGMGMGLYLVYPAFYTDVTDNYRLSRWGRLRTDLGGFYFNLLFVLALAAIFAVTGWEFMLLVIVLVNFQIVHQLLPFVRLDGYWTLVDLTGVPDFFQQMPAFFRSLVPRWVPGNRDRVASPLRWWARLILGVYILITIPLLLFMLTLMAITLPRVFATAFDAAGRQWDALAAAASAGDVVGVFLHPLQALLILLPVLGSGLILSSVARRLAAGLFRWSAPTWKRRIAGSGATAMAGFLMLSAWVPQFSVSLPGSEEPLVATASFKPIRADERGTLGDSGIVLVRDVRPAASANISATPPAEVTATPSATAPAGAPSVTTSATGSPSPTGTVTPSSTRTVTAAAGTASAQSVTTPTAKPGTPTPAPTQTPAPATAPPATATAEATPTPGVSP